MMDERFPHGWKSNIDGTREPISNDEASALLAMIADNRARQAAIYPTTYDALRAFIDADERLSDLGWRRAIYDLPDGAEVALIQRGSTGIFRAVWRKPYLHHSGCVSRMGDGWIRPVAELAPEEAERIAMCEEKEKAMLAAEMETWARLQAAVEGGT